MSEQPEKMCLKKGMFIELSFTDEEVEVINVLPEYNLALLGMNKIYKATEKWPLRDLEKSIEKGIDKIVTHERTTKKRWKPNSRC